LYQQWRRKYQALVDEGHPDAKARSSVSRFIPDPRRKNQKIEERIIPRPPAKKIISAMALLINGDWDLAHL
jgi:hypothetical protein